MINLDYSEPKKLSFLEDYGDFKTSFLKIPAGIDKNEILHRDFLKFFFAKINICPFHRDL